MRLEVVVFMDRLFEFDARTLMVAEVSTVWELLPESAICALDCAVAIWLRRR